MNKNKHVSHIWTKEAAAESIIDVAPAGLEFGLYLRSTISVWSEECCFFEYGIFKNTKIIF